MKIKKILLVSMFFAMSFFAQELSQTFLSLNNTGVQDFLKNNPTFDGRGTIVFILDTGVDIGIPGLLKTTTGHTKVVDVQDFTGQGNIPFYEAEIDEVDFNGKDDVKCFINEDKDYIVAGADKLSLKPVDGDYFIGVLEEKLWMNSNSGLTDINENNKEDDKFYFVTFKVSENNEEYWVVYFDTNGNGDLSDEKPIRNYKEKLDMFYIANENGLPNLNMGLNIFPEKKEVVFHFDDGGHGTHCAGIATGNKISNELNGVAPGANLISLKIGHNNYSGGATVTESMKKAYLYAAKLSNELKKPCIINMSYGIGSEIEGHAEMETFLKKLVEDNPYLYICVANGNEGTGISSSGLPACSPFVLSSGAVLAKEVGRDDYGATIDRDIILYFSSRGGEVNKPDIVSPGACTSTIPNWNGWDRMWGTSMASPYTTGVTSLLLSAANQEFPDVKIPSLFLYQIIRQSAVPQKGYQIVDQGHGMINVIKAWELLKKSIKNGELKKFETYKVSSFAPNMPNETAQNLYIRDASYLTGNETFSFRIRRNDFIKKNKFYRTYKLVSDSEWLQPIQKRTYLRNNQSTSVTVKFDKNILNKPGLYSGRISAYRADNSKWPEFEMVANIVVPYHFTAESNYRLDWKEDLKAGEYIRHFISVPAGASSMTIKLKSELKKYSFVRYLLHDPDGTPIGRSKMLTSTSGDEEVVHHYYDLKPGVYEVVTEGYYKAKDISSFVLSIEFGGVSNISCNMISENHNSLNLINNFNIVKTYDMLAEILGYEKRFTQKISSKDLVEIPFTFSKDEALKTFEIKVSKEDFNKLTDFSIMIVDENGKTLTGSGLSYRSAKISIRNRFKDNKTLKLKLVPGFTNAGEKLNVHITETTKVKTPETVKAKVNGRRWVSFYPSVISKVILKFDTPKFKNPAGTKYFGNLQLINSKNKSKEYVFPLYFIIKGEN